jgi:hypothetical protein
MANIFFNTDQPVIVQPFFRKGEKNISHPLAFQIAICYL